MTFSLLLILVYLILSGIIGYIASRLLHDDDLIPGGLLWPIMIPMLLGVFFGILGMSILDYFHNKIKVFLT